MTSIKPQLFNMSGQMNMQPAPRNNVRTQELFSNLHATLQTDSIRRPSTPVRRIREDDYTVPAPPPPSPVSFRNDGWPKSRR